MLQTGQHMCTEKHFDGFPDRALSLKKSRKIGKAKAMKGERDSRRVKHTSGMWFEPTILTFEYHLR